MTISSKELSSVYDVTNTICCLEAPSYYFPSLWILHLESHNWISWKLSLPKFSEGWLWCLINL